MLKPSQRVNLLREAGMDAHWAQNGIWQSITVAAPQKGAAFLFLGISLMYVPATSATIVLLQLLSNLAD